MDGRENKFDRALDHAVEEIGNWKYKDHITKIYLYGSCARGEEKADSDVDLYVELEMDIPISDIRDLKVRCNPDDWRLPEVDVKVGVGENTLEKEELFYKNIKRDGIVLWEKK